MKDLKKYFEKTENVNIEPYRCYYIPFAAGDGFSYDREKSSKFVSLNGTWHIKQYESFYDVPENFPNEMLSDGNNPSIADLAWDETVTGD